MSTSEQPHEHARADRDEGSPREDESDRDAAIKKTYILSTSRQRAHWIGLMIAEKKRTGDASLNLSEWIIRQLPSPDAGESSRED